MAALKLSVYCSPFDFLMAQIRYFNIGDLGSIKDQGAYSV